MTEQRGYFDLDERYQALSAAGEVHASGASTYGSFKLGATEFALDRAAEGLGGRAARCVRDIRRHPGRRRQGSRSGGLCGQSLRARGLAAGFARLRRGGSGRYGARTVKVRKWDTPAKIVETALSLFTMPAAQPIEGLADKGAWGFRAPLQFFARALPPGQSVFDGKANPVEAAIGAQGHQRDRTRNSVDADYRHRQELPRQSHRPSPDHIARRTRA